MSSNFFSQLRGKVDVFFVVFGLFLVLSSWLISAENATKVDEPYHLQQISYFQNGRFEAYKVRGARYPFLAMIPGYHAFAAVVCSIDFDKSLVIISIPILLYTLFILMSDQGMLLLYGFVVMFLEPVQELAKTTSSSSANFLWSLACWFVLTIPIQLAQLRRMWLMAIERSLFCVCVFALCIRGAMVFTPLDPRNQKGYELIRNEIMLLVMHENWLRLSLGVLVGYAIISVMTMRWVFPGAVVVIPIWILQVIPVMLIDPRYYIPGILLVLLLRHQENEIVERLQLFYSMCVSASVVYIHAFTIYFL